jgi:hypothetical protein
LSARCTVPVMTDTQTGPTLAELMPTRRRRWIWPVVFGVALVLLVAVASAVGYVVANRKPSGGTGFTLRGELVLGDPGVFWSKAEPCSGKRGYEDLTAGTPVTITDAGGQTIGLGSLRPGVADSTNDGNDLCKFAFSVPNVPVGKGFYGAEIGKRGVVQFDENQAKSGVQMFVGKR